MRCFRTNSPQRAPPSVPASIHVSTDCVFSAICQRPARYSEDDVPDAPDVYGRSKLLGEVVEAPGLTLRTSMIGRELPRRAACSSGSRGKDGEQASGSPNALLLRLHDARAVAHRGHVLREHPDLSGLWHVAAEPIDKYDLLLRLRDVLGVTATSCRATSP